MPLFSHNRDPSPEVYEPERNVAHHDTPPKKHAFFHRRDDSVPEPIHHEPPVEKKTGLFHRKDDTVREPVYHEPPVEKKAGLFHRRDRSPDRTISTRSSRSSTSDTHRRSGGPNFLQKAFGKDDGADASVLAARERVMDAEQAELEADRVLEQARLRVREAREHAKRVELEAEEEARRAKIKQAHARDITKRGQGLGRKLHRDKKFDMICVVKLTSE